MNSTITKVYKVLKDCYKFIDYRCAYFKEDDKWVSIISTFRFTNKEYDEINEFHDKLRELSYNTDWFKIEFNILKSEGWKKKWEEIKKDADFLKEGFDLDTIELYRNLEFNWHSPITQVDREYNTIQFNVVSYEYKEHHKRIEYLKEKKELRSMGITSIYPIIKQTLQIQFDENSQIFSFFLFPIYFKIKNVSYSNSYLTGDMEYHKIFYNSNLIIKHFLRGTEKGIIKNYLIEDIINQNQNYYKSQFEIFIDEDLHQIEENFSQFILNLYFSPLNLELTDFSHYASKAETVYEDVIPTNKGTFPETKYEYDFALSFAGENRDIAEKMANELPLYGAKVFYDKFKEADLIGKKLSTYFQDTYGSKSRYVIVLISKEYQIKDWTNFELKIAREEAKIRSSEFILPVKLDDTPILGIHDDIGYVDYRENGLKGTVNLLIEKLKLNLDKEKSKMILNDTQSINLFKETAMNLLHEVNQTDINISTILPKYLNFLFKTNNKEEAKWVQAEISGNIQKLAEENHDLFNYRIVHGYMSPYKFNFMFNDLEILISNPKNLLSPFEAVISYSLSSIEEIRNDPSKIGVVTLSKTKIESYLKEKKLSFENLYFYFKGSEALSLIRRIRQKISSFLVKFLN